MNRRTIFIVVFMLFFLALSFFVSSDTGGLNIDTDTLEQRENKTGQVTARLRIDILTTDSAEEQTKAQAAREQRLDNSVSYLFSNNTDKNAEEEIFINETLFQNPKSYYLSGGIDNNSSGIPTVTIIIAVVVVTAASYAATLIYRNTKKRES